MTGTLVFTAPCPVCRQDATWLRAAGRYEITGCGCDLPTPPLMGAPVRLNPVYNYLGRRA